MARHGFHNTGFKACLPTTAAHLCSLLLQHHALCCIHFCTIIPLLDYQVYKSHLTEGRAPSGPAVDSARQNLASTFVNAFVNAGFGQDKLMTVVPEGDGGSENVHWIFKNKVRLPLLQASPAAGVCRGPLLPANIAA